MTSSRDDAVSPVRHWQSAMQRWINRRAPAAPSVTLDHRKLFILPTRAGLATLLLIALLWLLGTNYENNLVLALALLLLSLLVLLPLHTFGNLSGIRLQRLDSPPAFSGDFAALRIAVSGRGGRSREGVEIFWPGQQALRLDLMTAEGEEALVTLPVSGRGRVRPPRLYIQSRFPLGLFRCWSRVDLDVEFLVYPQPKSAGPLPDSGVEGEGEALHRQRRDGDDFAGLKSYRPGDSLRQVAWKQYAGGRELHSKEYHSSADPRLWLDWDQLAGRDVETRLSNLCHWALQAERENKAYGLRLPGGKIEPGLGVEHQQRVLTALALFPVRGPR
ncbi:DUF58 domain-containing protein [Microbulbifer discodermiae]|uniref:DUF58 domain-containing protein n=1 Tax=Microbulbifer sp. 2201CG32-9 TaxID=3232309 RepID=UPI00345C0C69